MEVWNATDNNGMWERFYDGSDQTTSYLFHPYDRRASERNMRFEPQNGIVPSCRKPQRVIVTE